MLRMNQKDWSGDEIARACGISCNTVYQWVWMYNKYGPLKGRGGRRTGFLSLSVEKGLLLKLVDKAEQGQVVTAQVVKREVEKCLGKRVSKDYAYDLLHRHNWRKIKPRPHHPKRNVEVQETLKKTSKTCWIPPE